MALHAVVEAPAPDTAAAAPKPAVVPFPGNKYLSNKRLFQDSLVEGDRLGRWSKPARILVSLLVHVVAIAGVILVGLYYADTLDMRAFTATFLVAPPPPPPPPAAPAAAAIKSQPAKRVFMPQGKLLAPTYIPKEVAQIKEAPLEADALDGVAGGVPGGVPGGQLGGVIGGIVGTSGTHVPVPSTIAAPASRAPIRVGGRVRPPRILVKTPPLYPAIARATRVQGNVEIDAVIDTEGNVVQMRAVSGHPMLIQAALNAVSTWKFEPTYLNDRPVAVQLVVTVAFALKD